MTVKDFAQILRSRWKLICGATVLAVLAAFAYSFVVTPQYQATTRMFVATTSDGTNTQTYDGGLFAERRVLSYTELVMGELLAQRTVDKLGLDMTAADLQAKIEATVPADTVLIDVAVTDSSASRARDIANTLADEFVVMAAALETPELGAPPNARVVIQQRAELPDSPMSAKTTRMLAIAAVTGALLGICIALVRDRMDDTVKSADVLEKVTGVGLLADVPFEEQRAKGPLPSFDTDRSKVANAYRELRINLRFLQVADGPRVLLIASCGPDDGRTTTAVNLALALAEANHSVVIVDADLRRPVVAAYLELPGQVGFSSVLNGEASIREALQDTSVPRLKALTSGPVPPNPTELLESPVTGEVLGELSREFDYVIVDSPSLLVTDAALLASRSQGVLVVARFGKTTRKQLTEAVHRLTRAGGPLLGAVLTMTPPTKRDSGDTYDVSAGEARAGSRAQRASWRRGAHGK
ncbi:polysaccharide biosynthesis tyrosine autokinase [Mycolicibacterium gilvum]|uniref:non-specific protein-tyrosine kinase n=1 Tax=Mycolicibacterium gilvum TaxID=1804 RepID=A0A378SSK3_9MYCO|nr:polysaccharide biosynthesis tyrosine autokinase [Mycolicibacterium gilvum]STZ45723.1 capsular exopolysaccharide biosynthesis protein [Mycolicibacterium gilvum]